MSHFDNIEKNISSLRQKKILDLGCGRGSFIVQAAIAGCDVVGLEKYEKYIRIAKKHGQEKGLELNIIEGVAEDLPFADNSFDFINISEVIEHVNDSLRTLQEVRRTLRPGGQAYMSVPNRFSFKDPHYKLFFINWLPRTWAEIIIRILGKTKKSGTEAGFQKLSEMHYYTYANISKILKNLGFNTTDSRKRKIIKRFDKGPLGEFVYILYLPFRNFYFGTFHLYIKKEK